MTAGELKHRAPRALTISGDLSSVLASLAARDARQPVGEVDLDQLFAIEVALGFSFPDDILAAYAAPLPSLRASHRFSLADIIGHCGRLREAGLRGDLIGIACEGESEFVIDKRNAEGGRTVVCQLDQSGQEITRRFEPVEFLCEIAKLDRDNTALPAVGFAATLHRKPPMARAPGRHVIHAKFGRGTAFSEKGDGPKRKVTCDFPGVGLKVIQARFLRFEDEQQ